MKTKTLNAGLLIRSAGDESEITITTPATDLMRDTIDPKGMEIATYLNGTRAVNFAHDHSRLPIGKTLTLAKTDRGIRARFKWIEGNPEARVVRAVFEEGVLGASVEFVAGKSTPNKAGGFHFSETTLTGWALTANPANPECVRVIKALGLDTDDDEIDITGLTHDDVRATLHRLFSGHSDDPEIGWVTPAEIRAAYAEVLAGIITDAVRNQMNQLTGRVD